MGSDSLVNEVELLQLIDEVFKRLGIRIVIKLNNRKVLAGIAEVIGEPERLTDITVAIDKIDKIGLENVKKELEERGLGKEAIEKLVPVLSVSGTAEERLASLKLILAESEIGLLGVAELEEVMHSSAALGMNAEVELDVSLARGLNYYTGTIIEVKALDVQIGSISGGGRYDNLTGVFGMPGLSGVGISFGADRIYDVLTALDLFPATVTSAPSVMFSNFGAAEAQAAMSMMKQLRQAGIACEVYPDAAKMKKQMGYADARAIPYVALVGEEEMKAGKLTLKSMTSGEQTLVTPTEAIAIIKA